VSRYKPKNKSSAPGKCDQIRRRKRGVSGGVCAPKRGGWNYSGEKGRRTCREKEKKKLPTGRTERDGFKKKIPLHMKKSRRSYPGTKNQIKPEAKPPPPGIERPGKHTGYNKHSFPTRGGGTEHYFSRSATKPLPRGKGKKGKILPSRRRGGKELNKGAFGGGGKKTPTLKVPLPNQKKKKKGASSRKGLLGETPWSYRTLGERRGGSWRSFQTIARMGPPPKFLKGPFRRAKKSARTRKKELLKGPTHFGGGGRGGGCRSLPERKIEKNPGCQRKKKRGRTTTFSSDSKEKKNGTLFLKRDRGCFFCNKKKRVVRSNQGQKGRRGGKRKKKGGSSLRLPYQEPTKRTAPVFWGGKKKRGGDCGAWRPEQLGKKKKNLSQPKKPTGNPSTPVRKTKAPPPQKDTMPDWGKKKEGRAPP